MIITSVFGSEGWEQESRASKRKADNAQRTATLLRRLGSSGKFDFFNLSSGELVALVEPSFLLRSE